eukprot:CAMPEP_0171105494 /NCGR_PEP_ID=MMETSP0766_2-20121228/62803_1 /TAXON_ID=439317 /ORGANISM="Gambierdiscus australes, Strain CAWD 149" /LENGTH=211 /DNA_ID=CAMNT_0011566355 /DNA_START=32 /DNA_END=664 /DNA_ORIENTATION=+
MTRTCLLLLCLALVSEESGSAADAHSRRPVLVTLIEEQGCPDCTMYGDRLVEAGLKKGLGAVISLSVRLCSRAHPGIKNDPDFHPWVACANDVMGDFDRDYWWFQVAACANPGQTIDACIKSTGMPVSLVQPIRDCMNDELRASALVAAMHHFGDSYHGFPLPLINGNASLPEPDKHGDDVEPLISAICSQAGASGLPLPHACRKELPVFW